MITKLTKHDTHNVKIYLTRGNFLHSYALRCDDCCKHIQWLSAKDAHYLQTLGIVHEKEKYENGEIHAN